jgi:hypothetical protein
MAQGIVSKVDFTFFDIFSSLVKLSHAIFSSKSQPVGGHQADSITVILASFIFSKSFLNLCAILIEVSFLQYSFFIKFIVILA